jgi:hypothetical protein
MAGAGGRTPAAAPRARPRRPRADHGRRTSSQRSATPPMSVSGGWPAASTACSPACAAGHPGRRSCSSTTSPSSHRMRTPRPIHSRRPSLPGGGQTAVRLTTETAKAAARSGCHYRLPDGQLVGTQVDRPAWGRAQVHHRRSWRPRPTRGSRPSTPRRHGRPGWRRRASGLRRSGRSGPHGAHLLPTSLPAVAERRLRTDLRPPDGGAHLRSPRVPGRGRRSPR